MHLEDDHVPRAGRGVVRPRVVAARWSARAEERGWLGEPGYDALSDALLVLAESCERAGQPSTDGARLCDTPHASSSGEGLGLQGVELGLVDGTGVEQNLRAGDLLGGACGG